MQMQEMTVKRTDVFGRIRAGQTEGQNLWLHGEDDGFETYRGRKRRIASQV
jgi:hypothetical protein